MWKREETHLVAIVVLSAMLVAASNAAPNAGAPLGFAALCGLYLYWLVRLFIEALLFVALRQVIERALPQRDTSVRSSFALATGLAFLVSLPPFVLAITAFDLVLGYPELGIGAGGTAATASKITEFAFELLYLSDNHLALCGLLSLPRLLMAQLSRSESAAVKDTEAPPAPVTPLRSVSSEAEPQPTAPAILARLEPPLAGEILWAEAQEHYVRLTTTEETRMVLHRFSDILHDLPAQSGLQVHRSHWVAFDAIAESFKDGANLRLRLQSGAVVPVSRSFRSATERVLAGSGDGAN